MQLVACHGGPRQCGAMKRDEFNSFCAELVATSHVVQWGNADVWKVGGKVFAVCGWADGHDAFTFKVGEIAFEVLGSEYGIRPAPYLASRGMKWLQVFEPDAMNDETLKEHLLTSYALIASGLSKKKRAELGIVLDA